METNSCLNALLWKKSHLYRKVDATHYKKYSFDWFAESVEESKWTRDEIIQLLNADSTLHYEESGTVIYVFEARVPGTPNHTGRRRAFDELTEGERDSVVARLDFGNNGVDVDDEQLVQKLTALELDDEMDYDWLLEDKNEGGGKGIQ